MTDLKPCPFCGKDAIAFSEDAGWDYGGNNVYRAYCGCNSDECGVGVELFHNGDDLCDERDDGETTCSGLMDKAIEAWNRRAIDREALLKIADEIEENDVDGVIDLAKRIREACGVEVDQ